MTDDTSFLDALRDLLGQQMELQRLVMYLAGIGPVEYSGERLECTLTGAKLKTSTLLALAGGQSQNTILRMSGLVGIPVRDAYPIGRSIVETFANAAYLVLADESVAERAVRHVRYANWKFFNRKVGSGEVSYAFYLNPELPPDVASQFAEFEGKGALGSWTNLDLPSRILHIQKLSDSHGASAPLMASYGLIYHLSSEIVHGSPFGVDFFYRGYDFDPDSPVEGFRRSTRGNMEEILLAAALSGCGYLWSFFSSQGMKEPLSATEKVRDQLIRLSLERYKPSRKAGTPSAEGESGVAEGSTPSGEG